MIESKVINPKKFPDDGGEIDYKMCFDYLEKLNENFQYKRLRGLYIEACDEKIRPGMGILYRRIKRHAPGNERYTVRLKNEENHQWERKYILIIPLTNYFPDRFISDNELDYLETRLIEEIINNSHKKNLANKSYREGDLHSLQIEAMEILYINILNWIKKFWYPEFYGKNLRNAEGRV